MYLSFMCLSCVSEFSSGDDFVESEPENFDVHGEGAVLEVVEVKFESSQHFLHGIRVAVVECGVGGDAGAHAVEFRVSRVVLHDLFDVEGSFRAWSDESHVSDEDVPELWQFIQVVRAEEASCGCQAVVGVQVAAELWSLFLGIHAHGSEFSDEERFAAASDSLLFVNHVRSKFFSHLKIAIGVERGEDE